MYAGAPSTSPPDPITRPYRPARACSRPRDKHPAYRRIYAAPRPDYMQGLRTVSHAVSVVLSAGHREGESHPDLALAPQATTQRTHKQGT